MLLSLPQRWAKLDEVRKQLAANIDSSEQRKAQKLALVEKVENTFEAIVCEWLVLHSPKWASNRGDKIIRRLEKTCSPGSVHARFADFDPDLVSASVGCACTVAGCSASGAGSRDLPRFV